MVLQQFLFLTAMLYLDHDGVTGSHVKRIDWLHRRCRMGMDGISFILAGGTEEDEGERQTYSRGICVGSHLSTGVMVASDASRPRLVDFWISGFLVSRGSHASAGLL
jgi:hypothetical protein